MRLLEVYTTLSREISIKPKMSSLECCQLMLKHRNTSVSRLATSQTSRHVRAFFRLSSVKRVLSKYTQQT
jgi:hypothetical protein